MKLYSDQNGLYIWYLLPDGTFMKVYTYPKERL